MRIDTLSVAIGTIHLLPDRLMKLLRFASWDAGKKRVGAFNVDTTSALWSYKGEVVIHRYQIVCEAECLIARTINNFLEQRMAVTSG